MLLRIAQYGTDEVNRLLHFSCAFGSFLLVKLRSSALREWLGLRRGSGRLLARGSRDHSLLLMRSPRAWRIDLLFGDYLSVPLDTPQTYL
jgi:hypothetical protein